MAADQTAEWVARVLGIKVGAPSGTARAEPQAKGGAWRTAREAAVASLRELESAIREMQDPDSDAAIILVRAIRANLTERPATQQQVDELERYLKTDDIIGEAEMPNGFGLTIELRAPLLAALSSLRTEMQSSGSAAS